MNRDINYTGERVKVTLQRVLLNAQSSDTHLKWSPGTLIGREIQIKRGMCFEPLLTFLKRTTPSLLSSYLEKTSLLEEIPKGMSSMDWAASKNCLAASDSTSWERREKRCFTLHVSLRCPVNIQHSRTGNVR